MKIINFKGKNWIGVGVLLDETSGKPQFKQRKFSYCLKEETSTSALCGYTHVRYLMNPKHDVLNKVLKIFSSIEFVNSASQPPAPGHSIRPR